MSFELERIVNQLEIVTKSLDFIDRNVTEHEKVIETLSNTEKVDNIIAEM
jgi:prefoldin subunit 5